MEERIPRFNVTAYTSYPDGVVWFGTIGLITLAFFGTVGNFFSIVALVRSKRIRNATIMLIVNLCAADFMLSFFAMPLIALTFKDRNWLYSNTLCRLLALVKFCNLLVTTFTIFAITFNRYILIVHPGLYPKLYSKRNTLIGIACLWIFPLSVVVGPLFDVWGTLAYNPKVGDCTLSNLNGKGPRALIIYLGAVVPSVSFIFCYIRIYFAVKSATQNVNKRASNNFLNNENPTEEGNKTPKSNTIIESIRNFNIAIKTKKEYRVLRICLVIFIIYTMSTLPAYTIKLTRNEPNLPLLNTLGYVLYYSTSVINPVVYIFMSKEYRSAYKELFTSFSTTSRSISSRDQS